MTIEPPEMLSESPEATPDPSAVTEAGLRGCVAATEVVPLKPVDDNAGGAEVGVRIVPEPEFKVRVPEPGLNTMVPGPEVIVPNPGLSVMEPGPGPSVIVPGAESRPKGRA